MESELYKVIKLLNPNKITEEDKKELLTIFLNTNNYQIRNRIAILLSDVGFNSAIPLIIKVIFRKDLYNRNGSLVYALYDMDVLEYFLDIVKIIATQDYEARIMAIEIIKKFLPKTSDNQRKAALKLLEKYRLKEEKVGTDLGAEGRLHFIEQTIKMISRQNTS